MTNQKSDWNIWRYENEMQIKGSEIVWQSSRQNKKNKIANSQEGVEGREGRVGGGSVCENGKSKKKKEYKEKVSFVFSF